MVCWVCGCVNNKFLNKIYLWSIAVIYDPYQVIVTSASYLWSFSKGIINTTSKYDWQTVLGGSKYYSNNGGESPIWQDFAACSYVLESRNSARTLQDGEKFVAAISRIIFKIVCSRCGMLMCARCMIGRLNNTIIM